MDSKFWIILEGPRKRCCEGGGQKQGRAKRRRGDILPMTPETIDKMPPTFFMWIEELAAPGRPD